MKIALIEIPPPNLCRKPLRHAGALVAALALCVPAFASLGGNINSVEADRAQMKATTNVTQASAYDVHRIQSPGGVMQVDEYVSSNGTVFAVAWHGQVLPQMRQILGAYYQQYVAALAAQQHHYGHRPLNIELPNLVIQTGGHMRDYFGRVYVPNMLPASVKAEDIQ